MLGPSLPPLDSRLRGNDGIRLNATQGGFLERLLRGVLFDRLRAQNGEKSQESQRRNQAEGERQSFFHSRIDKSEESLRAK